MPRLRHTVGPGCVRSWLSYNDTCPQGPTCRTPSELSKLLLNIYKRPPRCPWPWPPGGLWIDWRLSQALQTAGGRTRLPQPLELSVRFRVGRIRKKDEGKNKRQHMERQGTNRLIFSSSCRYRGRVVKAHRPLEWYYVGFWVALFSVQTQGKILPSLLER